MQGRYGTCLHGASILELSVAASPETLSFHRHLLSNLYVPGCVPGTQIEQRTRPTEFQPSKQQMLHVWWSQDGDWYVVTSTLWPGGWIGVWGTIQVCPPWKVYISPVTPSYCVPILYTQMSSKSVLSSRHSCCQQLITEPAEACWELGLDMLKEWRIPCGLPGGCWDLKGNG